MANALSQRSPPLRRVATLALLFCALVLSQTLGFVHRSLHGLPAEQVSLHSAQNEESAARGGGWIEALFSHDADTPDCKVYDGCAKPGYAPTPPALVDGLPLFTVIAFSQADFVARWAAFFDARGPPFSR
jgi:hypothetical protein